MCVVIGGVLATLLHLTDVTVPVYPMLYGNVNGRDDAYDMAINSAARRSTTIQSDLWLCWGASHGACP